MNPWLLMCVVGLFLFWGTSVRERPAGAPLLKGVPDWRDAARGEIARAETMLQEGDLVVRLSREPSSQLIRALNREDRSYSHAGMVVRRGGKLLVLHAVSGSENPEGGLIAVPFPCFTDPVENHCFGVFRFRFTARERDRLVETLTRWETQRLRFDSLFDLRSDDRMYCSELVKKAVEKATANRIRFRTSRLKPWQTRALAQYLKRDLLAGPLPVIPIDALYRHPHCRELTRVDFSE